MTGEASLLYHGSNVAVKEPVIRVAGFYKDFGHGFYCTNMERQARRWAMTKRPHHVVSVYRHAPDESLKTLTFPDMTEEWLDFIVACRRGIAHSYDTVEGPMANDQIWDYVEDFAQGNITREAFWVLAKFRRPTHQLLFRTDRAPATLTFIRSYQL